MNAAEPKLRGFERYLTLWVGLRMAVGVALGKFLPAWTDALRRTETGAGNPLNFVRI